jgi:hypothetical protein
MLLRFRTSANAATATPEESATRLLLGRLPLALSNSHAWPSAILLYELGTGAREGDLNRLNGFVGYLASHFLKIDNR